MKTTPALLLLAVFLTACQAPVSRNIDSPYYAPPAGSALTLHKELVFPAGELGIVIQAGAVMKSSWSLDSYDPHCDFELYKKTNNAISIKPERFRITRVQRATELVMYAPVHVAGLGISGPAPLEEYQTIMYLHSDKQPNVYRMTCKHWEDPSDADHLSIRQIREALGELFSLELAEQTS